MTTFYLLRHAHSQANLEGILAGQIPDIHLSKLGHQQSQAISKSDLKVDLIVSSPLERCVETIKPYAIKRRKRILLEESFIEMNYGEWSGRKLKALARKRDWLKVRRRPSTFTFPSGEGFATAENRVKKGLTRLSKRYPKKRILIVSHGDIIKMIVNSVLDLPLDKFQRIVVDPSSLSVVEWGTKEKTLLHLNMPTSTLATTKKKLKDRATLGGGSNV